ncbi:hypothetical protein [Natronobiforma cellulositropha]|uniref:hypothetical protein n=1 Tax=Natronobiforma cellulositropha TaxID=1679076 RepID=UPI0021D5A5E5|nr:hypothetical protein [Natronobiforma cellulositropha]
MALSHAVDALADDPRLSDPFLRLVSHPTDGDVLLVGVVHDHPASVARVRLVCGPLETETLALELPTAALPLYRSYARDETVPPRFGGEMSAAMQAADAPSVIGIDAPNWSFLRRLCARLVADRASPTVARRVLSSLGGATREALACRVAATLTHATSMTVTRDDPIRYGCSHEDSAERQADHERAHVAAVQALLAGTDERALTYRDETRERCMIDRLASARASGDVVAVVGVDHVEALAEGLSRADASDM